jgi:DNA-binding NarL/FixJ family response regulator
VAGGGHYTSPALTSYLVKRTQRTANPAQQQPDLPHLSPTERHVLKLIAEYKTNKEIAEELGINYRTVETHRSHIRQKYNLEGNHALMKFALSHQSELL